MKRPLLNCADAATYLGFDNERPIRRWVAEGKIPYVKLSRFVRFDPDDLDAWIAKNRREPLNW